MTTIMLSWRKTMTAMSDCGDGSVDGDCIPDGEGVCADDGDAHGDSPRDRTRQSEA